MFQSKGRLGSKLPFDVCMSENLALPRIFVAGTFRSTKQFQYVGTVSVRLQDDQGSKVGHGQVM